MVPIIFIMKCCNKMAVGAEGTGVKQQLSLASHYMSHLTHEHVCVYIAMQAMTNSVTNADSRGPQRFLTYWASTDSRNTMASKLLKLDFVQYWSKCT